MSSFTTSISTTFPSTFDTVPDLLIASLTTATLTVARLVSVAECIKSEPKSRREMGLFQYYKIGTLEDLQPDLL